ncbi:MAG: class I tRNA ligase family protein, partial [Alphaproteobacteria bacterium]|nr:class I tRNA ligase family protein [Alphaproteobacteria bacterium]
MKYLITSALPYVNGTKHLGNLVGSLLPADVYARYLRARGEDVLYICATDEHGSPTEIAAKQEGITPEALCERQYKIQLEMNKNYNLKFDYFGRSSSENNTKLVQHIAEELEKNGFIEEKVIKQFYSIDDDMFLADRFIIGTCPHCGNTSARGDQCEICTQVLDPVDLINPRSAISGSSNLELRETRHLFLAQSKLAGELEAWINKQFEWPKLVKSIALKWLKEGLQDRCITR